MPLISLLISFIYIFNQTSRNIHIDYGCEVSAIYSLEEFKGKKLKETVPKGVTKQDIGGFRT